MPLGPMKTKAQKRAGMEQVLHEYKHGQLHSGSKTGPVVKNRKQALAIALSQTGQSKYRQEGGAIDVDGDSDDRQMAPWIRQYAERRGKDPNDLSEDEVRQLARERARSIPWVQTMDRLRRSDEDTGYARGGGGNLANLGKLGSHLPLGMSTVGKFKMRMPKMGRMRGFQHMPTGGFVDSSVPGRTDKHYVTVPSGSYVLPADHVSALGQNNSIAGAHTVRRMFGPGTKFGPRLAMPRFAGGGAVEPVPIVVAGGEMILPPNIVRRIGNGDIDKGHDILDRWVMDTRKKHVEKLKTLKPPKGSD